MATRLDVHTYLRTAESNRPSELVWGVVREPAAPFYNHQAIVVRLTVLLSAHARRFELGSICISPIDVVLDPGRGLVVQPDVSFVVAERHHIIKNQIWGPPDLTIEVLSRSTASRDQSKKLMWYRRYGVRECWMVDPSNERVIVHDLNAGTLARPFAGRAMVRSAVLPRLRLRASHVFD
jgi:Uma2 family endonuclease